MNTNDDEVLADLVIKVFEMEKGLKKFFTGLERRMARADQRNDLSIKRLVKLESRAEEFDKKLELSIASLKQTNKNLGLFSRKLEQSLKDQEASSRRQAEINEYFLKQIRKNGHK